MLAETQNRSAYGNERGATLYIVALSLVVVLAVAALAIDLVALYVARNQAQRAADAAALAGASVFVTQGCTSLGGCSAGGPQEAPATTQAIAVASQNLVFGQAPSSSTMNVGFSYPNPEEPQITVTVSRDAAHGNAVPTVFARILGMSAANISASATAEAYNPSGGGTSIGVSCLRPFLVPNCDPVHPVPGTSPVANTACPTVSNNTCATSSPDCQSYFFYPPGSGGTTGAIVNNSAYNPSNPTGSGAIGEPWQLHDNAAPSQWYLLGLGTVPSSGTLLRQYIESCAPQVTACNSSLNTANGFKVGPTDQGINALINASGDGPNNGQDLICSPTYASCAAGTFTAVPPFPITGGANNPNPNLVGQTFYSPSSSIASVAVYDGHNLCPGGSCSTSTPGSNTVTVLGYMQLFIVDAQGPPIDSIDTVIMNIGGCGTSTTNPPPGVSQGAGGSFIPIRLIHQ